MQKVGILMKKWINNNKEKIDFVISLMIMLVSLYLVISEESSTSQNFLNYCLIGLAVIYVLFKILIAKSNSNAIIHTFIHVFWLALLFIFWRSSYSIGNITTFATASLAFISCDLLLGNGIESPYEKKTRKTDTLICLRNYMRSVKQPKDLKKELTEYQTDILTLRDVYQRITMDNCFYKKDREKFQKENQAYYKTLGYIDKKPGEIEKDTYVKFYYSIMNFINDQSN